MALYWIIAVSFAGGLTSLLLARIIFKNANAADGWKEVDKKISTGQDEQGRMYVGEIKQQDTKFVVLIGHKKNQSKDFEYMKNNHPSKMIEDK